MRKKMTSLVFVLSVTIVGVISSLDYPKCPIFPYEDSSSFGYVYEGHSGTERETVANCYKVYNHIGYGYNRSFEYCLDHVHPDAVFPRFDDQLTGNSEITNFIDSIRMEDDRGAYEYWLGLKCIPPGQWYWTSNGIDVSNSDRTSRWFNLIPKMGADGVEWGNSCSFLSPRSNVTNEHSRWKWTGYDASENACCDETCPRRFMCMYELYQCHGYWVNDTDNVCSGNGLCVRENNCSCINGYTGTLCNISKCEIDSVSGLECSGNGECLGSTCECTTSHHHGDKCSEVIGDYNGTLLEQTMELTIPYVTSAIGLPNGFQTGIDCSSFVEDYVELGGSFCRFTHAQSGSDLQNWKTIELIITFFEDNPFPRNNSGILQVKTSVHNKEQTEVSIYFDTVLYDPNDLGDTTWVYFLVSGTIITCFFVVVIMIPVILIIFYVRKRKKLEKKHDIKKDDVREVEMEDLSRESKKMASLSLHKELFNVSYEDLSIKRKLGTGGFAAVYLAIWHHKEVAFKVFQTKNIMDTDHDFYAFEREVELLSIINHVNICSWYGAVLKPPRVGILLEYCEHGDLEQYLTKNKTFPIVRRLYLLQGVVNAFVFLHRKRIIHRDLKPENVLLNAQNIPKLTDFGLSRRIHTQKLIKLTTRIGTSLYMAPEMYMDIKYTSKVDVFSFGMMCYTVISGNWTPFSKDVKGGASNFSVEAKMANDRTFRPDTSELPEEVLTDFPWVVSLMKNCWEHEPEERKSMQQIFKLMHNEMQLVKEQLKKNE